MRARKTRDEPTFVPLLQLLLVKVCRVLQLLELLLRQLGLAVFTKLSAQLLRRGCGLLCLGVGIQGLVFIGREWGGGMMQWLVGPWPRGRKSKPQPRASDDGACRPPVQPPVARSRARSDCLRGGGGDQGNGKYGMRDAGATHDFPMSATETTTEEEMGEEGDRWRIDVPAGGKEGGGWDAAVDRWCWQGREKSSRRTGCCCDGVGVRVYRREVLRFTCSRWRSRGRSSFAGARIVGVQVGFQGVQSWLKGSGTCSVDRFEGFLVGRWAAKEVGERGSGLGIGMRLARSAMEREMGGEFRCVGNV